MATLKVNIQRAISDFNDIEAAIEESGINVPYNTDTSEYGNLVRQAVASGKGIVNADTHYDFPSVGKVDVIYKAQSERLIYQWNPTELKYEALGASAEVEIHDIELINGGNANG